MSSGEKLPGRLGDLWNSWGHVEVLPSKEPRDFRGAVEVTDGSIVAEVVDECFAFVII